MVKRKILGFSLVELMVVIAIVGILSAVALPNFRDYVTRSRLGAVMPVLNSLKTKATDYYNTYGSWPTTLVQLGLVDKDAFDNVVPHVTDIGISGTGCASASSLSGDFCIYLQFDSSLITGVTAPQLMFTAEPSGELLDWRCTTAVVGTVANSIPQKYLPGGCTVPV